VQNRPANRRAETSAASAAAVQWWSEMDIRSVRKSDVRQLVTCWNDTYTFDLTDQERFQRIVLDDPNFEPEGTLVAEIDGKIGAFASCVVRRTTTEPDGIRRRADDWPAYLKAVCWRERGAAELLLDRACRFASSQGKSSVRVVEYGGGSYFYPGIDLRYEAVLELMASNEFRQIREVHDVSVDLRFNPPRQGDYQQSQAEKVHLAGIRLARYSQAMLATARTFASELGIPTWFEPGWQDKWADGRTIVALDERRIVGFSRYHPHCHGPGVGGLGPIGTLESFRGKGIGTSLLDECMRRLSEAGCSKAIAGWAKTPFYLRNGWHIERRYAVLEKHL